MRFDQLKKDPNSVVKKKMYKKGKNWIVATMLSFAGGMVVLSSVTPVLAETINTQVNGDALETSKVTQNSETSEPKKRVITGNLVVHSNFGDQILYNVSGEVGTTIEVSVPDVDGFSSSDRVTAIFNEDGTVTTKDSVTYGLQWINNNEVVYQAKVGTSTAYACSNNTIYVTSGTIDTNKFREFINLININIFKVDFTNFNTTQTKHFDNLLNSDDINDLDISNLDMTNAITAKN